MEQWELYFNKFKEESINNNFPIKEESKDYIFFTWNQFDTILYYGVYNKNNFLLFVWNNKGMLWKTELSRLNLNVKHNSWHILWKLSETKMYKKRFKTLDKALDEIRLTLL